MLRSQDGEGKLLSAKAFFYPKPLTRYEFAVLFTESSGMPILSLYCGKKLH
jgi:hypothetical protein